MYFAIGLRGNTSLHLLLMTYMPVATKLYIAGNKMIMLTVLLKAVSMDPTANAPSSILPFLISGCVIKKPDPSIIIMVVKISRSGKLPRLYTGLF